MVRRRVRLAGDSASVHALAHRFARARQELGVTAQFPAEVLAAAEAAAQAAPGAAPPGAAPPGAVPSSASPPTSAAHAPEADLRDLPFVTVDPPGSTDLDQAMHLTRRGDGFGVDYAIADVPAFVAPGSPLDVEARRRGQTLYAPDGRIPLHPPLLSENAASLLPDQDRLAYVWRFQLDGDGQVTSTQLVRAVIRSRRRLDYESVQTAATGGPCGDRLVGDQAGLLREIGQRRLQLERARGGASLPLPEQEVVADGGRYTLTLRPALPAEDWNAQLSLMTGMAAAQLMLQARAGLLRTMPAPDSGAVDRFRRQGAALGVPWPPGQPYGEFLRGLDRDDSRHLALIHEAAPLFRGAGYTPLDPTPGSPLPQVITHAAVAAPYAHVTAPLRRLVDRFGLVACHAIAAGAPVPGWVLDALPALPAAMAASDQVAGALERTCLDAVEAAVLQPRLGQEFDAVVVDVNRHGGKVQLSTPAVLANATGELELGARVRLRLVTADVERPAVAFGIA